jgi:hypothetical protein
LKDRINELQSNSKHKNITDLYGDINEYKKGYQPRTNLSKDERGYLLADPHNILNRWKYYFCQLLNVQGASGIRQTEMHTAVPFVPDPSVSEAEVSVGKLKRCKPPGAGKVPAELIQAGGETLLVEIHKLIKLIWNKEELPHQLKESVVVPSHKKGDKTVCSNYQGISLLSTSYEILSNILLSRVAPHADKSNGHYQCRFRHSRTTTYRIFYMLQILEKKWENNGAVHQLFIDFKKAYDSVKREELYNIPVEFGIARKLVGIIKMCLNEAYSTVHIGKNPCDKFSVWNCLR